jgi:hypothetical protein
VNNYNGAAGLIGRVGLELEVSRHRHLCRLAIVRHGSVQSAAARRGIGPAAKGKQVEPCERMVATRRLFWFGSMCVGKTVSAASCESTNEARIRNSTQRNPNCNFTSGSTDGGHIPARPMAAHQLRNEMEIL